MFPFQSGELSFQVSNDLEDSNNITNTNTNLLYHHEVEEQVSAAVTTTTNLLYQPHHDLNLNFKIPKTRNRRAGKSTQGNHNGDNNNYGDGIAGNDVANKKVIHREVERQRRQEMSNLHSSIRSLLPIEYIRGKRSVSDHLAEAARYIKDLEKNVKELEEKRDKLKDSFSSLENQRIKRDNFGCSSSSSTTSTTSRSRRSSSSNTSGYDVSIHKFSKTIQIEITAGVVDDDPYPLSNTLKVLAQQGLDVVSSVSSIVNQRWIYVIYCEVNDMTSVDSCHLQEKLMSVVSSGDS